MANNNVNNDVIPQLEPTIPSLPFLTRDMLKYGRDRRLAIRFTAAGNDILTVGCKAITRNGIMEQNITLGATGELSTRSIGIDDFPIWAGIFSTTNDFNRGSVWGSIILEIDGEPLAMLASGYLGRRQGVTWPAANVEGNVPGRGDLNAVISTNPAAGTEASITVRDGDKLKILGASCTLVTDANAANRRLQLTFDKIGGGTAVFYSSVDQTASTTRTYTAAIMGQALAESSGTHILIPLPQELWVPAGGTIAADIVNIQAGDDMTALTVNVERFFGEV